MELLKIRIQSKADAANGIPAIEFDNRHVLLCKDITIAFLEGGTVSGSTSVMIGMKDREGKLLMIGELTKGHLESAYQALQGAIERFGK